MVQRACALVIQCDKLLYYGDIEVISDKSREEPLIPILNFP